MIVFDNLSPEEQLKSVNKEINRMNLMIKMSEDSLKQLYKAKKKVKKKLKKQNKEA